MGTFWSRQFWANSLELAVFGAAGGVLEAMTDLHHPDWRNILLSAGVGAVYWTAKAIHGNITGKQGNTPLMTVVHPKTAHGWNPVDPLE
jgi:hypothetical protein